MIREQVTGYLFIAPAALLSSVFGVFPLGGRVNRSDSHTRFWASWLVIAGLLAGGGVGLVMGWGRMAVTGDVTFLNATPVTLYYALGSIPLQLTIALALAYILF